MEKCQYKNGKLHGLYEKWNNNGQLTQCLYNDGMVIELHKELFEE